MESRRSRGAPYSRLPDGKRRRFAAGATRRQMSKAGYNGRGCRVRRRLAMGTHLVTHGRRARRLLGKLANCGADSMRRDGRVVEGGGLENRCTDDQESPVPGIFGSGAPKCPSDCPYLSWVSRLRPRSTTGRETNVVGRRPTLAKTTPVGPGLS